MAGEETIGRATIQLGADGSKLAPEMAAAVAKAQGALDRANKQMERAQAQTFKAIQGHIDKINATRPTNEMRMLEQAVLKLGGSSKLSGDQLRRVTAEVSALAAAGAKVPASLQGLTGMGSKLGAAFTSLTTGGGVSGALAAIGPAGIAAAGALGAVTVAGGAALRAVADLASKAEEWTNEAKRTGLGVVEVQQLRALLEDAGIPAETLTVAMKSLHREIADGGKDLQKYGIDLAAIKDLSPEEQLQAVAQAILNIEDVNIRGAAAQAAFGKSGEALIPVLDQIAASGYRAIGALGPDMVKSLNETDQAIDQLARKFGHYKNEFIGAIAQMILANEKRKNAMWGISDAPPVTESLADFNKRMARIRPDPTELSLGPESPAQQAAKAGAKEREEEAQRLLKEKLAAIEKERHERKALSSELLKADKDFRAQAMKTWDEWGKNADQNIKNIVSEYIRVTALLGPTTAQVTEQFKDLNTELMRRGGIGNLNDAELKKFIAGMEALGDTGKLVGDQWSVLGDAYTEALTRGIIPGLEDAARSTEKWQMALGGVSDMFGRLSSNGEDTFAHLSRATGALAAGLEAIGNAKTQGDAYAAMATTTGAIGSEMFGKDSKAGSAWDESFKQADLGYKVGGPVGAIVGGVVGGVMGWIGGGKKEKEKKQKEEEQKKEQAKAAKIETRQKLEAGLSQAAQFAEQLQARIDAGGMSEKLKAAAETMVGKVRDALLKSGMGMHLDPALAKSEAFQGAQGAAGDIAGILAGMRGAGMVDAGLMGAAATSSQELFDQAVAAAVEAGKGPAEAQMAGFGAISQLLREQLNASIQSGDALDANTQKLLDEAKANGIEIMADPLIESLGVQRKMLEVLQQNAGWKPADRGDPDLPAAGGFGPMITPNLGHGLGPRIQTHPGELAMVIPRSRMGASGLLSAASGLYSSPRGRMGRGGNTTTINLAISENPFQSTEGARALRSHTLKTVERQTSKRLAALIAAGRA